jgi:hypothetical protein
MKVDPVQELIDKYKDALKYVDSSIRKKYFFAELCRNMGVEVVISLGMSTLVGIAHTDCLRKQFISDQPWIVH